MVNLTMKFMVKLTLKNEDFDEFTSASFFWIHGLWSQNQSTNPTHPTPASIAALRAALATL